MSDYCHGCNKDMWEYDDDQDWCVECAPEMYNATGEAL